jgi:hypothetical protein
MKKLVILFLSVVTSGFLLTSCSSSDDDESVTINGKWEFYEQGISLGGIEQLELYEHTPGCEKDFVELFSSGNYQDVFYFNDGNVCAEESSTGTWSRSGNSLTITSAGETTIATIVTLNNTTLKISITEDLGGFPITAIVVFKRP